MNNESQFETYLFISPKKFIITSKKNLNSKEIFQSEKKIINSSDEINIILLDEFLKENIFKIEKTINNFVKHINLIIDCKNFLDVKISIKKNNYGNLITLKNLEYILNEARDQCSKTLKEHKIIHMLIDNYLVDKKEYLLFPIDLKGQFFSIDLTFICLSNIFIKKIEKVLNKYQITTNHILYSKYIERFQSDQNEDIFKISMKMIDGHNENEVSIVPKKPKNLSFFERFFNFFS